MQKFSFAFKVQLKVAVGHAKPVTIFLNYNLNEQNKVKCRFICIFLCNIRTYLKIPNRLRRIAVGK